MASAARSLPLPTTTESDAMEESRIVRTYVRSQLERFLPLDFTWIDVVADETHAFFQNLTWRNLADRLFHLVVSAALIWFFWDFIVGLRALGLALAEMELAIALVFLPIALFFGIFEVIGVVFAFMERPTKKRFRIALHSTWIYGLLWGIHIVHTRYETTIRQFLDSVAR